MKYDYSDSSAEGSRVGLFKCIRETDRAILVVGDDGQEHWVPKSQIHDDSEVWLANHQGELVVTKWFAEQRGWR